MSFRKLSVLINTRRCLGCGGCMDTAPDKFRLGRQHSEYIGAGAADEDGLADIRACEMFCPVRAITVRLSRIEQMKEI